MLTMSFRNRSQTKGWYNNWYNDDRILPPRDMRTSLHKGTDNYHLYERCLHNTYTKNNNRLGIPAQLRKDDGKYIKRRHTNTNPSSREWQYLDERLFAWRIDTFFAENSLVEFGREAARGYEKFAALSRDERRRTNVSDADFFKLEVVNEVFLAYSVYGENLIPHAPRSGYGTWAAEGVISLAYNPHPSIPECFKDVGRGRVTWSGIWSYIEAWHDIYVRYLSPEKEASRVLIERQEAERERIDYEQYVAAERQAKEERHRAREVERRGAVQQREARPVAEREGRQRVADDSHETRNWGSGGGTQRIRRADGTYILLMR